MDEFVKQITNNWKEIIESINVDGYSRKVQSVDFFRMSKYYTGYPEIEWCYKVVFNFEDGISGSLYSTLHPNTSNKSKHKWHKELENKFTMIFWNLGDLIRYAAPSPISNSGETKFENSKVDYMTNQGYRFIVQFYPQGFLSEFREEKLKELGI